MHQTLPLLEKVHFPAVTRGELTTLQVNLGYRCNQQCLHCHVNAAPYRTEAMQADTIDTVLRFIDSTDISLLDLTGGAPELNPHFRDLVTAARQRGLEVMDRCNLTILDEPDQQDLAEFLASSQVTVTASLPCYSKDNVDEQRGKGVFETSIRMLRKLNQLGYGLDQRELVLNLVYNPQGPDLPPGQAQLEADYKTRLENDFGIRFNNLFVLANMPIQRFGSTLVSRNEFSGYMQLLQDNYKAENLETVMCRSLVSVDWQGYVYDCDFNQMLEIPIPWAGKNNAPTRVHLADLIGQKFSGQPVAVAGHCFGCTAGQGSSCGGALG